MTQPIVVLRPDDAGRVAMLHATGFADPWSPAAFRDLLSESTTLALGVERAGQLVAFVLVQTILGEADILTVATQPDFKRGGLARNLLQNLMSRLGERGISRITLDVAEDNMPARNLYDSLGFTEDGRRPGYYTTGRDIPAAAVLMSRSLAL
ncbi:MAG: ribosomal protein S18-alanine N-acetyltransferase [Hyphomonas sp.]|uniref:ribosomal protein S18-alanine N-acetyltransferase n=1 Tax=Hyphomonas sp. TaxID=87 RepID=UPI0030037D30